MDHRMTRKRASGAMKLVASPALLLIAGALGCSSKAASAPPSPNDTIAIAPVAHDASQLIAPYDATPDPTGTYVYATGRTNAGNPGVFKVGVDGTGLTKIFEGAPLVEPNGIAIAEDGQTLFIADFGAATSQGVGAVLSMPSAGGTPTVVAGTAGFMARGVEVHDNDLYVSGTAKGVPQVAQSATGGGGLSALAQGAPLVDPSGVAVTDKGDVFVVDSAASGSEHASVFKLSGGAAMEIASDIAVGFPAGLANLDDNTLVVSALDPGSGRDVVYLVDVNSGATQAFTKSIDQYSASAGLHRARHAGVFAWADRWADSSGTIFVLKN